MSNFRFLLAVLLIIGLPSVLSAVGMVGFVDEVFLQTKDVGQVRFHVASGEIGYAAAKSCQQQVHGISIHTI